MEWDLTAAYLERHEKVRNLKEKHQQTRWQPTRAQDIDKFGGIFANRDSGKMQRDRAGMGGMGSIPTNLMSLETNTS